MLVGTSDDIFELSPITKFILQLLAILPLILTFDFPGLGFRIFGLIKFFIGGNWAKLILLFWILGITNSINLIDGLDGLAGGIVLIVIGALVLSGQLSSLALYFSGSLAGALFAFSYFNCYSAKVFLGDGGSYFIGLYVAFLTANAFISTQLSWNRAWFILPAILVLALPIFDTIWAIIRRMIGAEDIFSSDKKHIHHRALSAFGHEKAVVILLASQAIFAVLGIIYFQIWSIPQ
jgi:UDP-GlcNAc:undecaprenyl-phosphate GlcNAc-1-phosphate transferase